MKIVFISDLHSQLDFKVPPCDVLCICGDITYHYTAVRQLEWINSTFKLWMEKVSAKYIVIIPGNHDAAFKHLENSRIANIPWNLLINQTIEIDGVKFWGSPYTPYFARIAFEETEDGLRKIYEAIPKDTDIILSHGPPFGIGDLNFHNEHCGSDALYDAVMKIKPKIVAYGHIHQDHGIRERDGIKFINCSLLDDDYRMVFEPIVIDFEKEE
ncbi:MAG: metallophosphatase domain-containing protein [Phenylobacterium sp.]